MLKKLFGSKKAAAEKQAAELSSIKVAIEKARADLADIKAKAANLTFADMASIRAEAIKAATEQAARQAEADRAEAEKAAAHIIGKRKHVYFPGKLFPTCEHEHLAISTIVIQSKGQGNMINGHITFAPYDEKTATIQEGHPVFTLFIDDWFASKLHTNTFQTISAIIKGFVQLSLSAAKALPNKPHKQLTI